MIYLHVVGPLPSAFRSEPFRPCLVPKLQPPLTQTCRTIRREALPIFYISNVFVIPLDSFGRLKQPQGPRQTVFLEGHTSKLDVPTRAYRWFRAIGDHNIEHLQHIILFGYHRAKPPVMVSQDIMAAQMQGPSQGPITPVRFGIDLRSLFAACSTNEIDKARCQDCFENLTSRLRSNVGDGYCVIAEHLCDLVKAFNAQSACIHDERLLSPRRIILPQARPEMTEARLEMTDSRPLEDIFADIAVSVCEDVSRTVKYMI